MEKKYENTKIENKAIHTLDYVIDECDLLDNTFNKMDKELSWDGYIYLYKEKFFSNKTFDIKIPVQIKGHVDEEELDINKKYTQYQISVDILENYYVDRGVLFFKIIISESKREIFYNILFPSKIKALLEEAKRKSEKKGKEQKTISIQLTKMRKNANELLRICKQYKIESIKQGSGIGQIVPNSINISQLKDVKKIEFTAASPNDLSDLFNSVLAGDICFYAKKDDSGIAYPIVLDDKTTLFVGREVELDVSVGGVVYYNKYLMLKDSKDNIILKVSDNLTINVSKGTFDFKKNSTLKDLNNDAMFLLSIVKNDTLYIGTEELNYSEPKLNNIAKDLNVITDLVTICEMVNVEITSRFDQLNKEELESLLKLVSIYQGEYVLEDNMCYWHNIIISDKIIPVIITKKHDGKICVANRIYEAKYRGYVKQDDLYYTVPMFCSFKGSEIAKLYKYDYADLFHQVEMSDYNEVTTETLNLAALSFIEAYDINGNEKLLEIASTILNKILEFDDTLVHIKINIWQIKKRLDILSDDIKEALQRMKKEVDDNSVLCGINILLDETKEAKQIIDNMPENDKELFLSYPIAKFIMD